MRPNVSGRTAVVVPAAFCVVLTKRPAVGHGGPRSGTAARSSGPRSGTAACGLGTAACGRARRPAVGHGGPRSGTAACGRAQRPDPTGGAR
ncbi:MAG: hypothetical protein H6638_12260 [Ardenticatenales bacterium]|nr:hypothetical protein [Ardenticatenales bacterium]